jgi:hypothetical protein
MPQPWRLAQAGGVSLAIDESIDDLRNDPESPPGDRPRTRMEDAPGRAPRVTRLRRCSSTSSERSGARHEHRLDPAPHGPSWAKFSQHEPEPEMRTRRSTRSWPCATSWYARSWAAVA